jgi:hypothetical protein
MEAIGKFIGPRRKILSKKENAENQESNGSGSNTDGKTKKAEGSAGKLT